MKALLGLVTLALAALIVEDTLRQVAADARGAYDGAAMQAREARTSVSQHVRQQPLISLLVAGGLAYALAAVIPSRTSST